MSRLRVPGVGPIVGHTTDSTCRLWIRAGDPEDEGVRLAHNRRTVGVIAITERHGRKIRYPDVYYFRLHREFDRTGTFQLGVDWCITESKKTSDKREPSPTLEPDTEYAVRLATLTVDDPHADEETVPSEKLAERLPNPSVWRQEIKDEELLPAEQCEARFRTFSRTGAGDEGALSFVIGSCRYPGFLWKVKEADQIFRPLRKEALGEPDHDHAPRGPTRFTLMVGDQIYADMLNRHVPVGLADTFEEFQSRYLNAFGSPNMRALLRRVPTYMILDDHEIEDNWRQDRVHQADKRRLFNVAIGAYMSYQWSHSPRTYGRRLYYEFDCDGYPFFVLDTRTQRFVEDESDDLEDNHMLGRPSLDPDAHPNQLELLLDWLRKQQDQRGDAPKFVATSSVFVPNPMSARTGRKGDGDRVRKWAQGSDSWPGFPATRAAILHCIVQHEIQNVVFLSGDIHCSNVARMSFSGPESAEKLRAFSIVSSAFYWPFPFADGDPSNYVHDSTKPEQKDTFPIRDPGSGRDIGTMDYKAWNFTQEDNYCRIDVDRSSNRITVRPYGWDGELLAEGSWVPWRGDEKPLVAELELAPW